MDQALQCELEALQETFDVTVSEHLGSHSISMRLEPYTGDEPIFVEAYLNLSLGHGYPETVPEVSLSSPKGLSDERLQSLLKATNEVAEELIGEPVLMTMCMAAKDALSQMNFPEGAVVSSEPGAAVQRNTNQVCFRTTQRQDTGAT